MATMATHEKAGAVVRSMAKSGGFLMLALRKAVRHDNRPDVFLHVDTRPFPLPV
jgi:hypothetical protein